MLTNDLAMQPSDRLQVELLHFNAFFYHCRSPNELLLYDVSRKKTQWYIARMATLQRRAPRGPLRAVGEVGGLRRGICS